MMTMTNLFGDTKVWSLKFESLASCNVASTKIIWVRRERILKRHKKDSIGEKSNEIES